MVRRPSAWSAVRVDVIPEEPVQYGEIHRCELCGRPTGLRPWLPPYVAVLETWGRRWADMVCDSAAEHLITRRMAEQLSADGITGLEPGEPVTVTGVRSHGRKLGPPPEYLVARVGRATAAVDDVASGIRRKPGPICPACRQGGLMTSDVPRIVLEPTDAVLPDIFIARGLPGRAIVSDRFVEWMARHGFEGVETFRGDEGAKSR